MKKWEILSRAKVKEAKDIVNILLLNRGVKTKNDKEEFLNPSLDSIYVDSVGISKEEVKKAIKRIERSTGDNEKIIIFGDYDVDGIAGSAILWETLFENYKNVIPYIPHRVDEGYGLSKKGIDHVLEEHGKVDLIITVDNGIVAKEAVAYAKEMGIDVIITDHHVQDLKKPDAYSIIHTTKLCGAAVAYILSNEIRKKKPMEDTHLELVALATVADLVPLVGANRSLVKFGVEKLRRTKRPGLLALIELAQIKKENIGVYEIGHIIAPRLNASGRIAHAMDSLRLLCTKDPSRAKKLAMHLHQTNRDRQIMTEEATTHANLVTGVSENIIVAHDQKYNQGIIGLVASRLVEKHYRPSIVISVGATISKGSARSVAGFNIIEFLRTFNTHLIDQGGHPMAAGFSIETSKIEVFKEAIIKQSLTAIASDLLVRTLKVDMKLSFNDIDTKLYEEIQKLAPFGMGNFEPIFVSKNAFVESIRTVGRENEHLKLQISQNDKTFDAIFFRGAESGLKIGDNIDVVYSVEQDNWNGNSKIQLKLKDVQVLD